jgi:hypothetical protein
MTNQTDEIIKTINIYKTTDYKKFSYVNGNRDVNESHKQSLEREMLDSGNFLIDDPVEVDKDFRIFDGQHSFEAAKSLKEPIYYIIDDKPSMDKTRRSNIHRRNWNWYDFATSYRDEKNDPNYRMFLELINDFGERFSVTLQYCTGSGAKSGGSEMRAFNVGEFVMQDYDKARKMLGQYQELSEAARVHNREFSIAAYKFMQSSTYNHARMLEKVQAHKSALNNCYLESDYFYTLQDIWRA